MNKSSRIITPILMLVLGLVLGVLSRLLDIYTQNLGNIFSQFAIWILLGTVISIYSKTKFSAMLNVFLLCIGMLATYYFTAFVTEGVYSNIFIIGWTAFALCSPIMAFVTWHTKEKGFFVRIISVGIVAVSFVSSILFFDKLRVYDFIINAVLVYFLFFKKIKRPDGEER